MVDGAGVRPEPPQPWDPKRTLMAPGSPSCIFLLTGEGAHSAQSDLVSMRLSPSWDAVEQAMQRLGHESLDGFLERNLGDHRAPNSPLVTTIINILNADRWRNANHVPSVVIGHSVGEVAAAYVAGMFSIEEALHVAEILANVGAEREGRMAHSRFAQAELHGWVQRQSRPHFVKKSSAELVWLSTDRWADTKICIAAVNGTVGSMNAENMPHSAISVTLCGPSDDIEAWCATRHDAKVLAPQHPWHHPMYLDVPSVQDGSAFATLQEGKQTYEDAATFVSATVDQHVELLDTAYWCR
jgi:hypothetical protein